MSASEIDVVEAAYRVEGASSQSWLQGVVDAASPVLADGLGLTLAVYSLPEALPVQGASQGTPPGYMDDGSRYIATVPEDARRRTFGQGLYVGTGWELLGSQAATAMQAEMSRRYGAGGAFGCIGRTLDDRSLYLHVATRGERPAVGREALWRRVMIHLLAGFRLLDPERPEAAIADAVLDPSGKVEHAEDAARDEDARAALCRAVLRVDRARTRKGRAKPGAALEMWRGLVHGRWSLIEQFDTDGRRFFVARRNAPGRGPSSQLTHRERQVVALAGLGLANGEIAYALGLADNTVGVYLSQGMRKLGIGARSQLVSIASAAEPGAWS